MSYQSSEEHLNPQERCDICERPATWVRMTQFAGNHYFCTNHAKLEEDFGQEDESYFFWQRVAPKQDHQDDA